MKPKVSFMQPRSTSMFCSEYPLLISWLCLSLCRHIQCLLLVLAKVATTSPQYGRAPATLLWSHTRSSRSRLKTDTNTYYSLSTHDHSRYVWPSLHPIGGFNQVIAIKRITYCWTVESWMYETFILLIPWCPRQRARLRAGAAACDSHCCHTPDIVDSTQTGNTSIWNNRSVCTQHL